MNHPVRCAWLAAVVTALSAAPQAAAQSTWNNSAGGSWNDPTSWTPNTVPNAAGATATFGSAASGSVNITLASDVLAGGIVFDSIAAAGAYNIGTSGRTLTLVSSTGIAGAQITVNSSALGLVGPQRFVSGQTLQVADLGGLTVANNGLTVVQFSGPVTLLNGGPLTVTGSGSRGVQFDAGTLSGSGQLNKSGATPLSLTGAQPGFTGAATIGGGVIAIDNANSLGADPAALVANQLTLDGGTLRATPTTAVTLAVNRGVRVNAGGGTFDVSSSSGTLQLNGAVSGSGSITKVGSGTLIFNGGNGAYTGAVAVNVGVFQLAGTSALGNGSATITVAGGAEFQIVGGINTYTGYRLTLSGTGASAAGAFRNISGSNTWTDPITLAGNALINTANNATPLTLQGGINVNGNQLSLGNATTSGSYSTITVANTGFSGSGGLVLDSGFTGGMTIAAPSAGFAGPTTIRTDATVTVQDSLGLGPGDGTANTGINVASGGTLILANTTNVNPVAIGNKPLTLNGGFFTNSSGALQGQGPGNSYAGPITLASAATIGASSYFAPGSLTLTGGIAAGNNVLTFNTFSPSTVTVATTGITGTSGVAVTGGIAQLAVASTYSGTTTVSGGRLLATNPTGSATGTSSVTVASGGTLAGGNGGTSFADGTQGFISGPVTVQSGGTIAPGNNGAGLLALGGGVTIQTGGALSIYLATHVSRSGASPADLNTNGRIHTGLALSFGTTLTLDIDGGGQTFPFVNTYDYYIALADGSVGTLPGTVTFVPTDFASSVSPTDFALSRSPDGHDLILTYTAVPEPGSLALLAFAATAGWRFHRRRLPIG